MRYRNNIKALQQARGLTIDQAAEAMGMSRGGYLKIQRGENRLTSTTLTRAAEAFRVAESEIVAAVELSPTGEPGDAPSRGGSLAMGHEPALAAEFTSVLEKDGKTTLPSELREAWNLKPGEKVEFFQDHAGGWQVRPRNAGPLDFLKFLPPRPKRQDALTDEDALTKAMAERNMPSHAAKTAT